MTAAETREIASLLDLLRGALVTHYYRNGENGKSGTWTDPEREPDFNRAGDLASELRRDLRPTELSVGADVTQMTEARAREILDWYVRKDGRLSFGWGVDLISEQDGKTYLDVEGSFTADQLEAIAWWMRNKYYQQSELEEADRRAEERHRKLRVE